MRSLKKICSLLGISALVICISAFNKVPIQKEVAKPTNIKVLPKNIDPQSLDKIMKGFNTALGVKCNHCHSPKTNGERGLDFASDANKNKDVARSMIKMTSKINKKYFNKEHDGFVQNISCNTCHSGKATPSTIALK